MQCPHVRFSVLSDAPLVLCVGPEQASGFGSICQAVPLPEFSVCAVPWLEPGMMHGRCSLSAERKYRGIVLGLDWLGWAPGSASV